MKNKTFKNSIRSILSLCILVLLSTHALHAAKPVKVQATAVPTNVIHSVVVDTTANAIVVTGAELAAITEVTLGGYTVTFTSADGITGLIDFTDIDAVVTTELTAGNYSLVLGDNRFSVYLTSADATAITPPPPPVDDYTACPCYTDWEQFGTNYIDPNTGTNFDGFEGASATCAISADQVQVDLVNDSLLTEYWFLQTNATAGTCSTPVWPGFLVDNYMIETDLNATQHNACANYLQATYCN